MVKTSRQRYIAFRVDPPRAADRRALIGLFQRAERMPNSPPLSLWLITYEKGVGVARCAHSQLASAVRYLNGIKSAAQASFSVKTMSASGTLRALRARHGLRKPKQDRDGHGTRKAGLRPGPQKSQSAGRRAAQLGHAQSRSPRPPRRRN